MEELIMSHFKNHFGVISDFLAGRVSIFDTDTLTLLQHIPLEADVIDVALTSDCRRAVVTSFNSKTIFQIDLSARPAKVLASATTTTFLEDVQITPDDMFALSVDGSADNQNIVSYSLKKNAFVSTLATSAQAVAISPTCDGLVLTAVTSANSVQRFMINRCGDLVDTGQQFPAGTNPININFSPNGNFAFVVDFAGAVSVLSTIIPDQISLISTIPASSQLQSMAISKDGRHLFVLGSSNVDIFTFDPVSGSLALARSFAHGLQITSFFGVDQIALDLSETRLFISAAGQVAVFTTFGTFLGTVADVSGPGGLVICPHKPGFAIMMKCGQFKAGI
jgi:DNA-binding beta-propeller fold protein YncE